MRGNRTVCEPLKYLILMSDNQEAKCFEFAVQILPPPLGTPGGCQKNSPPQNYFCLRPCLIGLSQPPNVICVKKSYANVKD